MFPLILTYCFILGDFQVSCGMLRGHLIDLPCIIKILTKAVAYEGSYDWLSSNWRLQLVTILEKGSPSLQSIPTVPESSKYLNFCQITALPPAPASEHTSSSYLQCSRLQRVCDDKLSRPIWQQYDNSTSSVTQIPHFQMRSALTCSYS